MFLWKLLNKVTGLHESVSELLQHEWCFIDCLLVILSKRNSLAAMMTYRRRFIDQFKCPLKRFWSPVKCQSEWNHHNIICFTLCMNFFFFSLIDLCWASEDGKWWWWLRATGCLIHNSQVALYSTASASHINDSSLLITKHYLRWKQYQRLCDRSWLFQWLGSFGLDFKGHTDSWVACSAMHFPVYFKLYCCYFYWDMDTIIITTFI